MSFLDYEGKRIYTNNIYCDENCAYFKREGYGRDVKGGVCSLPIAQFNILSSSVAGGRWVWIRDYKCQVLVEDYGKFQWDKDEEARQRKEFIDDYYNREGEIAFKVRRYKEQNDN